ncbi:MAG: PaaI family thioesterase [Candidatus Aminicenantes bacterium]|nr:PaaI family thioesterase [Candidatus Aminicenantes bacterium]
MSQKIVDYDGCFVCGQANTCGLKLVFYYDETSQKAWTEFVAVTKFEGYQGILHGGIISSVLDEVMIKAVLHRGEVVVTSRLTVEFKSPASIGEKLRAEGWVTGERGKIILTEGKLVGGDGRIIASGSGVYVRLKNEMAQRLAESLKSRDW